MWCRICHGLYSTSDNVALSSMKFICCIFSDKFFNFLILNGQHGYCFRPGNDWMNSQLWHNSVWFSSPYCSLGLQRACREQWLSSVLWFSVYSEVNLQIKQTLCWSCLDILNPFLVSTMDIHGSFSNAAKTSAVVLSRPVRRLFSRASQNRSTFHSALSDRCW